MRKLKKILSLVLALAMVITLLQGVGSTKAYAASDLEIDIATDGALGLKPGYKVSDLSMRRVQIAGNTISYVNLEMVFNNGKYDLDPDDIIDYGTPYTFTIRFTATGTTLMQGVTSARLCILGATYGNASGDYINATVSVSGSDVTIKGSIKEYPKVISVEQLGKVTWNLIYNNAVDYKPVVLDSKNVNYTVSNISWLYSADGGKMRQSVNRVDRQADGKSSMYIASFKLTAKDGYVFKAYTQAELDTLNMSYVKYTYTLSGNGKELSVTVTGLVPLNGVDKSVNVITELDFDTEREVVRRDGWTVYDYLRDLRIDTVRVGYNGGDSTEYLLDAPADRWRIYGSNGKEERSTNTLSSSYTYYLCYPLRDIEYMLKNSKDKLIDNYGLFDAYRNDNNLDTDVLKSLRQNNWTIKLTVYENATSTLHETRREPRFTFTNSGYTVIVPRDTIPCTYTAIYDSRERLVGFGSPVRGTAASDTVSGNVVPHKGVIYAARGERNTAQASPVVYRYYNPDESSSGTVSAGKLYFRVYTAPTAGDEIYKSYVEYRGQSENFVGAIATDKIFYIWNTGVEYANGAYRFAKSGGYTSLKIYIPIRSGVNIDRECKAEIQVGRDTQEVYLYKDSAGNFISTDIRVYVDKAGFITYKGTTKKLYLDLKAPTAGATVPTKVTLTPSSARYATFRSITWYEDGKKFTGKTFTAGKKYTADLELDGRNGYIVDNYSVKQNIMGDITYVDSAIANKDRQTITVRYSFGVCTAKKVKKIDDIEISLENGISTEAFKAALNTERKVKITFDDGTSENVVLTPGFISNSSSKYKTLYDQFAAMYPGDRGYDPNNKKAQVYNLYGNVDLSSFGASAINSVLVTIKVGTGGYTVKFDANGGTYLGAPELTVKNGEPYGFKYVKAEIYRAGYFFGGWFDAPSGGNRVYAKDICTGDITLYAHWNKVFTGIVKEVTAKSYSKGRLTVRWDNIVTKFDGFEVSVRVNGGEWSEPEAGKVDTKTKYYVGLTSGKTYQVRVRAYRYDSAGQKVYGAWSNKTVKAKVK